MNFQNDVLRMIDTLAKVKIGENVQETQKAISDIDPTVITQPSENLTTFEKAADEVKTQDDADPLLARLGQEIKSTGKGLRSDTYKELKMEHPELKEFKGPVPIYGNKTKNVPINNEKLNAYIHVLKGVANDRFMRKFKGDENK